MNKNTIIGKSINGVFVPEKEHLANYKKLMFKRDGKLIKATFAAYRKKRSLNQNDYGHGVLYPCAAEALTEATGEVFTPEKAKEILKFMFLKVSKNNLSYVKQTSDLNTEQTEVFYTKSRDWIYNIFGYLIPKPNEVIKSGFVI